VKLEQTDLLNGEKKQADTERWVLVSTILASSMAFIDGTALNVALPALQADLRASAAQLLWIINAYLLMLAALILVGGSLGDKFGRKRVFGMGIALFMLASLACGLAPSIGWMIPARIVQGIGGAFLIPGSLAIITASFHSDRRGKAIGTWSAATTLVTVIGPVLGGIFSDIGLWRLVFLINLPLGIITLLALVFKVPESRDEKATGPVDFPGAALVTLGLAGITYGLLSAPELGFGDPRVYATLLAGLAALILFAFVEIRSPNPMVPLHLFRSSTFSGANLLTFFLYGALSVGTFFLSLNLVQAQGYSKTQAGLTFLPFSILLTALSRWAGGLADKRGPRLFLILGPALVGCGFLWMGFVGLSPGPPAYWTTFFPGVLLLGLGMGLTVAPLSTSVMTSVDTRYSGTASGINNAVSRTAGVLAIAITGSIALIVFGNMLNSRTNSMPMPEPARAQLQAEVGNMGGASAPAGIDAEMAAQIQAAIRESFVGTFQLVIFISAGMCWVAALMAAWLVKK